ncbi:MAG: transposase, partial [Actinomycetota bacterium]|nr:transposase [Actinomycetota bacterium]
MSSAGPPVKTRAEELIKIGERTAGVKAIGVDEHIWRPSRLSSKDKAVTVMVDLTRDADGCLRARLLDAVPGRSGRVYADLLTEQGVELTVSVEHAALDPFRGYANAIRDGLRDATAALDALHVVKLGGDAVNIHVSSSPCSTVVGRRLTGARRSRSRCRPSIRTTRRAAGPRLGGPPLRCGTTTAGTG